ncbi:hypothetical protein ACFQMF_01745 [Halorubrum rutilum]|uniref:Uncharacterized protein n=1 Tax=Halorubrum rutilum TaxID=1364933 RepID=A0ABD6AGE1_9EURY|nr:hypothetical protein [Halorubrum rutilum]
MRLLDRIEVGFDAADAAVAVVIDERDEMTVVEVEHDTGELGVTSECSGLASHPERMAII